GVLPICFWGRTWRPRPTVRPRSLMDDEQTQVNLLVVRAFEALRIPYFLGGSMASSIHGLYRATADTDFVAAVRPEHAKPLVDLFHPGFYADMEAIRTAAASNL